MFGNFTVVEDNQYDAMVADFKTHPKPKKWKYRLRGSNGQFYVVENTGGLFWHPHRGHIWELIPIREALQMEQDKDFKCKDVTPSDVAALYKRGFSVRLAETLTYNHRPKKHPIRVSTRAGDPVRG